MITSSLILSLFAIFIAPQIIIADKFPSYRTSILLSIGFVISYSLSWFIFLFNYVFSLGNLPTRVFFIILSLYSLIVLIRNKQNGSIAKIILSLMIASLLLIPLFKYFGGNFHGWDAIVSWNRWAIQLYNDQYHPYHSAYPIFFPALWSLIYKVQGTSVIWWTAQATLFLLPIFTLSILIRLYLETKQIAFLLMILLIYPYLIWNTTISGDMDMPVALVGFLSLVMIYAGEVIEEDFDLYISLSLLLAGIDSIIKQAGISFLVFSLCYLIMNINKFKNKKIVYLIGGASILFPISYLAIFFSLRTNPISNIHYLERLAYKHNITNNLWNTIKNYKAKYFSYPTVQYYRYYRTTINKLLIITSYPLYYFFQNKKYSSITFMSSVAYLIGVAIWIKYFSYDPRNSYWTKMFIIIFSSIVIGEFFNKILSVIHEKTIINNICNNIHYQCQKVFIKIINGFSTIGNYPTFNFIKSIINYIIVLFLIILVTIISLKFNDNFAYKLQERHQSRIGNPELAKEIKSLLFNSSACVELYTNIQPIAFNYFTIPVKNKIKFGGYSVGYMIRKFIHHRCKDGRYILFGSWDKKRHPTQWKLLMKLEQKGLIKRVSKRWFLYFIPPNINIKKYITNKNK